MKSKNRTAPRGARRGASARNGARRGGARGSRAGSNGRANGRANGRRAQDAIALLKHDHETVRELLSELAETTSRAAKKREELCAKIGEEIRVHARIEERVFYPAFREAASKEEDSKLFFEATEEHAIAMLALEALEDSDPASEVFGARAKVVKDLIEHHAEEEEDEMFPRARKLLGADELRRLGEELQEAKERLQRDPPGRGELSPARRSSRSGERESSRLARAGRRPEVPR